MLTACLRFLLSQDRQAQLQAPPPPPPLRACVGEPLSHRRCGVPCCAAAALGPVRRAHSLSQRGVYRHAAGHNPRDAGEQGKRPDGAAPCCQCRAAQLSPALLARGTADTRRRLSSRHWHYCLGCTSTATARNSSWPVSALWKMCAGGARRAARRRTGPCPPAPPALQRLRALPTLDGPDLFCPCRRQSGTTTSSGGSSMTAPSSMVSSASAGSTPRPALVGGFPGRPG